MIRLISLFVVMSLTLIGAEVSEAKSPKKKVKAKSAPVDAPAEDAADPYEGEGLKAEVPEVAPETGIVVDDPFAASAFSRESVQRLEDGDTTSLDAEWDEDLIPARIDLGAELSNASMPMVAEEAAPAKTKKKETKRAKAKDLDVKVPAAKPKREPIWVASEQRKLETEEAAEPLLAESVPLVTAGAVVGEEVFTVQKLESREEDTNLFAAAMGNDPVAKPAARPKRETAVASAKPTKGQKAKTKAERKRAGAKGKKSAEGDSGDTVAAVPSAGETSAAPEANDTDTAGTDPADATAPVWETAETGTTAVATALTGRTAPAPTKRDRTAPDATSDDESSFESASTTASESPDAAPPAWGTTSAELTPAELAAVETTVASPRVAAPNRKRTAPASAQGTPASAQTTADATADVADQIPYAPVSSRTKNMAPGYAPRDQTIVAAAADETPAVVASTLTGSTAPAATKGSKAASAKAAPSAVAATVTKPADTAAAGIAATKTAPTVEATTEEAMADEAPIAVATTAGKRADSASPQAPRRAKGRSAPHVDDEDYGEATGIAEAEMAETVPTDVDLTSAVPMFAGPSGPDLTEAELAALEPSLPESAGALPTLSAIARAKSPAAMAAAKGKAGAKSKGKAKAGAKAKGKSKAAAHDADAVHDADSVADTEALATAPAKTRNLRARSAAAPESIASTRASTRASADASAVSPRTPDAAKPRVTSSGSTRTVSGGVEIVTTTIARAIDRALPTDTLMEAASADALPTGSTFSISIALVAALLSILTIGTAGARLYARLKVSRKPS